MYQEDDIFIHDTAIIDHNVQIGSKTKIWHFSHLLSGVSIGRGCTIGQNVMVGPDVDIGDNCKIQNNVSLYKGLCVAKDVFIGPSVVFTNVKIPRAFIEQKHNFESTVIETGASIGANATILCGITIGKFSMVAAGATVTKSVKPHSLVIGCPAVHVAWVSHAGCILSDDFRCTKDGTVYEVVKDELVVAQ